MWCYLRLHDDADDDWRSSIVLVMTAMVIVINGDCDDDYDEMVMAMVVGMMSTSTQWVW